MHVVGVDLSGLLSGVVMDLVVQVCGFSDSATWPREGRVCDRYTVHPHGLGVVLDRGRSASVRCSSSSSVLVVGFVFFGYI